MRYGSVCSGIEAATVAWHPLGWRASWLSEIEPFPCSVLAHHYPDVPNRGDMTRFQEWPDDAIDLLVGGTPCQSFSIAGLRAGLADPRGNLMLTYLAIAAKYRPRWLVWENVPGVLSSNGGRDFGTFLRGLGELGYGFAYRVLDAQFCRASGYHRAVPQRRRRVFVVGYSGDWRRAAAVLFDGESLRGDSAPSRRSGEIVAATLEASVGGASGKEGRGLVASTGDVSHCLNAGGMGRQDFETETMVARVPVVAGTMKSMDGSGGWSNSVDHAAAGYMLPIAQPIVMMERGREGGSNLETRQDGTANTILTPNGGRGGMGVGAIAFDLAQITSAANRTKAEPGLPSSTLSKQSDMHVATDWAVRRLTPTECERLQGFPDGYTAIPHRNKPAADGPRYKALGNSMAVNVMRVIGERMAIVDAISEQRAAA